MRHQRGLSPLLKLLLLVFAWVPTTFAQTTHRPIGDFVNAQVSVLAWSDSHTGYEAVVDFAGYWNQWVIARGYPDLGTTFSGDVSESVMSDGRTHVSVLLHTKNALTRGLNAATLETLLGFNRNEILQGASPVLGDCFLTVDFAHAVSQGGQLPDLNQLFVSPTPDQEILSVSFVSRAQGPLRAAFGVSEGTPGVVQTTQISRPGPGKGKPFTENYAFPSDFVWIRVLGN